MLTHPTLDQLKALRLDGMLEAAIELEAQDATADMGRLEWLGLLVDRQKTAQETKRFNSRLRAARLRHVGAAPEDVDFRTKRGLDKALIPLPGSACLHAREGAAPDRPLDRRPA